MTNQNSKLVKCQNCQKEFAIEPEDFDFYQKINVPPPTWCPECRMIRRLIFRNERSLYWRKCDLCGEKILSMYPSDTPFPVYCFKCWSSDKWDAIDYGLDYDWNKPFLKHWQILFQKVPRYNIYNLNTINSLFGGNLLRDSNNIYLSYSIVNSEDVYYSKDVDKSKYIFDSLEIFSSENIYQSIFGYHNYNCKFVLHSRHCIDSSFLYNCINCSNCFLSTNLRNKNFFIRNKQYSKKDYYSELNKIALGSYQVYKKLLDEFFQLILKTLHRYGNLTNCIQCTGDDLFNSKNAHVSFNGHELEDVKFTLRALSLKDSWDFSYGGSNTRLVYEHQGAGISNSSLIRFNLHGTGGGYNHDLQYTAFCGHSSYLFGCVGLRHKQYCILNKQYTKEKYEKLVPKIIEHMDKMPYVDRKGRIYKYGEFFPPELSPFAYNETIAQEYFPLTKEQALEQGYRWKEPEERNIIPDIKTEDLPDHIKDVDDSIIGKVIQCAHAKLKPDGTLEATCNEQCTTAFKIIPDELQFYRKMNLPLPRLCPNCRHYQRIKQRNPLKLWKRKCQCAGNQSENGVYKNTTKHFHGKDPCPNEFETTYAPDRPEIVYCEACYLAEVV